jgi:hypothetical protein
MTLPSLTPPFARLNEHLFRSGVMAIGAMQPMVLKDVSEVAAFQLGFDTSRRYLVTVMLCDDDEAAVRVEAETRNAPQASAVTRNGPFVMACTFAPANPILERRFAAAFGSFQFSLRTTT